MNSIECPAFAVKRQHRKLYVVCEYVPAFLRTCNGIFILTKNILDRRFKEEWNRDVYVQHKFSEVSCFF
jgi:hypothetical protein